MVFGRRECWREQCLRRGGRRAVDLVSRATVYDLGRPLRNGMAQSPSHPQFHHCLDRLHGDRMRPDGGSAAADLLTTGSHVGTHVDALAHVSHEGRLYGGVDAAEAQAGGNFAVLGIHELPPFVGRGVLLDVPRLLGVEICKGGHEVSVAELQSAAARQRTAVGPGDAVLVRSGWERTSTIRSAIGAKTPACPVWEKPVLGGWPIRGRRWWGPTRWRSSAFPAGQGHALLPAHRVLLVERGINIIEAMDLDSLAADGVYEFVFVLSHLNIFGATGAPVRPLALA